MWVSAWSRRVLFIHDIKSLQSAVFTGRSGELSSLQWRRREERLFSSATHLIVHSPEMEEAVRSGYRCKHQPIVHLRLFDYLCTDPPPAADRAIAPTTRVAFCGNMHGSTLWSELCERLPRRDDLSYQIYGDVPSLLAPAPRADMQCQGHVEADALPQRLLAWRTDFGLCWWASRVLSSGYLELVAPHKASCYLAAGVPLIAPHHSYLGRLIRAEGIGITIESLEDLDSAIQRIGDANRRRMQLNVLSFATRVRTGYFTQNSLKDILL